MEMVLDLITSYESRISTVEELISTAYQTTIAAEGCFGILDEERDRLRTSLQKTLAKNCFLRRKDFNRLMERTLSNSEEKRGALEEERSLVKEKVKEYLDEQKQLANCLRQQLVELAQGKMDKGGLDVAIGNFKAMYEGRGQQLFTMLRDFQIHLEAFQIEQEEINHKLQALLDRGESLRIEDIRQLEATKAHQDRKADRELRRNEVDKLLSHFRQQRLESRRSQQ
jgi:hypothetical protein